MTRPGRSAGLAEKEADMAGAVKRKAAAAAKAKKAGPKKSRAKKAAGPAKKTVDLKTKPTAASVEGFLASVSDERRREECRTVAALMRRVTGEEPRMWGASIVGFGTYRYRYASGREGDWLLTGFSPRKEALTLYLMAGFEGKAELTLRLGRHRIGKGCLYLSRLSDVDLGVLEELVRVSVTEIRLRYP